MRNFEYILDTSLDSFNLVHIFECGQCFRWEKQEDESYIGIIKDTVLRVKVIEDKVNVKGVTLIDDGEEYLKFYFDLNADGDCEYISKLGSGSGYLALDKNNDGIINNGSELFGTKSGDGFGDLAIFDEDQNGWIDENDAIWDKLKIWTTDENGNDELYTLKKAGVGAICLQKVNTNFSHTDSNNEVKGAIRSTGIFLYENGNVGTIQHLDLVT